VYTAVASSQLDGPPRARSEKPLSRPPSFPFDSIGDCFPSAVSKFNRRHIRQYERVSHGAKNSILILLTDQLPGNQYGSPMKSKEKNRVQVEAHLGRNERRDAAVPLTSNVRDLAMISLAFRERTTGETTSQLRPSALLTLPSTYCKPACDEQHRPCKRKC
jgi:hypothetical protein